jgi:restriction endonuclease S subunit
VELKKGYKQTEAGVIPEEWDARLIRDVCKLINGRGFKPHEWKTSGLPIIRIQNLNGSDDFNYYTGSYNPKILVETGQLLFAWSGSRCTSFGPHVWNGGRALLNYHTWKVAVNESKATQEFLLHALRHLTSYIEDRAHGASALVHTQKWEMEKFSILIPSSLPEQHAIAAALSNVDGLIGGLEQLIAKKRDLKQAAMQQLLTGKKRLAGFRGEWAVKRLGEIAEVDTESLGSSTPPEYEFNYISLEDVDAGTLSSSTTQVFSSAPSRARRILRKGDILVSTVRPNLQSHLHFTIEAPDWVCSTGFTVLRCRNGVAHSGYFFSHLFGHGVSQQIDALLTGSNYPSINSGDVRALQIPFPPFAEQTAIAEVLSNMDAELAALEQRRDKTRNLKQGMMQALLTGKTRLV